MLLVTSACPPPCPESTKERCVLPQMKDMAAGAKEAVTGHKVSTPLRTSPMQRSIPLWSVQRPPSLWRALCGGSLRLARDDASPRTSVSMQPLSDSLTRRCSMATLGVSAFATELRTMCCCN